MNDNYTAEENKRRQDLRKELFIQYNKSHPLALGTNPSENYRKSREAHIQRGLESELNRLARKQ